MFVTIPALPSPSSIRKILTAISKSAARVDEITENGAEKHIDKMAKKYLDKDKYPFAQPGEKRVLIKITPDKFSTMG